VLRDLIGRGLIEHDAHAHLGWLRANVERGEAVMMAEVKDDVRQEQKRDREQHQCLPALIGIRGPLRSGAPAEEPAEC